MTDDPAASGQIGPLPDLDSIAPDRGGAAMSRPEAPADALDDEREAVFQAVVA